MNEFSEIESDFYQYLVKYGNLTPHTRTNYMSWLRFLAKSYKINDELTVEAIDNILSQEKEKRNSRTIYKTEKDIRNFYFALKKLLSFLDFDFSKVKNNAEKDEIEKITHNTKLTTTERSTLILSRVGQGVFRKQLLSYWQGCAVSKFNKLDILVASHIKPWKDSDNHERMDLYNGLLLLPNYDKLFDKGYISFDMTGKIIYSRYISDVDMNILSLSKKTTLVKLEDKHKQYLKFHNKNYFMG